MDEAKSSRAYKKSVKGGCRMQLEPIVRAKMTRFQNAHGLEGEADSLVFERYVNNVILSNHQPNGSNVDDDLLDAVGVGGFDDIGLDGICVKLNGMLIKSIDEARDIIDEYKHVDIEFIFIQSKYTPSFKQGEYLKFANGVYEFLSDKQHHSHNEGIARWLEIKDYLIKDEIMQLWDTSPKVRIYYVAMGKWNNDKRIIACSDRLKDDLKRLNMYEEPFIFYIDTGLLKKLIDNYENKFSSVINIIAEFPLTDVEKVNNSAIMLCSASELMKLLVTEDGILRKGLFNDNVRDYQGETTINHDIRLTIEKDPQSFVLMNNGVTIICSDFKQANRKVSVLNPQIVNGCQTCSALYYASMARADISEIAIICKIISTEDPDITNNIIRGTNRQNIVYDEAFECTREFHKQLEELFNVLSENRMTDKIYYERRSKQYNDNVEVKSYQRVSFRILIRGFVSIFLNEPHMGCKHESKLLQMYRKKIFLDSQSKEPYYVSSLIYVKTELFLKSKSHLYKDVKNYHAHLQMIIRIMMGGYKCDINNEKSIDKYCDVLLSKLDQQDEFCQYAMRAVDFFRDSVESWVQKRDEGHRFGIKDSSEFTNFLLMRLSLRESQSAT